MKLKNFCAMVVFLFLICGFLSADAFSDGEALFRANKPHDAIAQFKLALSQPYVNPAVYTYLGLAYYQTGQFKNSLDTFLSGTKVSGTNKRVLYYNAANTAFAMGDLLKAEECYTLASVADPDFSAVYLNRANARLKLDKLDEAVSDYEKYLLLDPNSSQAEQIRKLLTLLASEKEIRIAEQKRLAEEAERIRQEEERLAREREAQRLEQERLAAEKRAEEERIAAEKAAKEAERRRKLLEEVAASLQDNDSANVSAGTEGVMGYDYEGELD